MNYCITFTDSFFIKAAFECSSYCLKKGTYSEYNNILPC